MVAIVTGNGLGLVKSSANMLGGAGQLGSAGLGRANDGVYVNASTGNLVITNRDELLIGRGPDSAINRTYNSLGQFTDENGDNWANYYSRVVDHVGTLNTAGAYLDRLDWDGGRTRYTFDASKGVYVSKEGGGSFDSIGYDGSSWWWKDGDSGLKEVYSAAYMNRVVSKTDRDGNAITYSYASGSGPLTRITTADGNYTDFSWSGNNLTNLVTTYTDTQTGTNKTLTRTRYTYDGYNRLATVTVDLSPNDSAIVDGRTYTTTYQYVGTSKLVQYVSQTDGTQLQIGYDASNRVSALTQTVENGVTRVTNFTYGAGYSQITDPQGNVTTMYYDGAGQLTTLAEPPAAAGGNAKITDFGYDGNGNLTTVFVYDGWTARGNGAAFARDWYRYDGNGNVYDQYRQNNDGYLVTRYYYNAQNQVSTESSYTAQDIDGHGGTEPAGAQTTRYVYDSENHLRFRISPEGRVTEYRYDAPGNQVAEINYVTTYVETSALAESANWVEADFINWVNWVVSVGAMTSVSRTDTSYDFRGNVSMVTSYAKTDVAGNGILDDGVGRTLFVYDQYGNLLSKQQAVGSYGSSLTDLSGFAAANLSVSAVAAINGKPANQYVVQAAGAWTAAYAGLNANAGDTFTTSFTVRGTGTSSSFSLGLYGNTTSWGPNDGVIARIVSGPGTIIQESGGLFNIDGLSITQETRVEITRLYKQAESGGVYLYVDRPQGWRSGAALVISDPVVTKAAAVSETYAYDGMGRTIRVTDAKGVGTWTTYIDAQNRTVVTLASGLTQTSSYNRAGELVGFAEANANFVQENATSADINSWNSNAARVGAGTIDGAPATQMATASGQTYAYAYSYAAVEAGDTMTWSISIKGNGSLTSAALGIWAGTSGWGSVNMSSARIVSGPGTLTQDQGSGGYFGVSGLSTTEATRIEVTRIFTQSEYGYPHFYSYGGVGEGVIVGAQTVTKARYNEEKTVSATEANVTDINAWGYSATRTAAGTIGAGSPAAQYTVQANGQWTAAYAGFSANAGDAITTSVSLMATATGNSASLGIYGNVSDWGRDGGSVTARIISGPGTLTQEAGYYQGLWNITGLSTTQATRIEITRTFSQTETGGVYLYPDRPGGWIAGHSIIAGAPSLVKTPGDLTAYKYDSLGRLRIKRDPAGARTFYFYDNASRKIGEVAADGAITEYKYDAEDQLVATVRYATALNAGQIASLFDWYGNASAVEFASIRPGASGADRWNWNVYDFSGRLIETIDAVGAVTAYQYDAANRITKTTRYYNQFGVGTLDQFKAAPPAGATYPATYAGYDRITRNFYDRDGLLVGTLDAENYLTEFVHDKAGRQTESVTYWSTPGATYLESGTFAQIKSTQAANANDIHRYTLYDGRGLVGATIDGEGNVTRYSYDARGQVSQEVRGQQVSANIPYTLANLPAASGQLQVTNFVRDARGQLSSQTRLVSAGNSTSSFAYNAIGNLASLTDAKGYQSYKFYDARGRLVREEVPTDLAGGVFAVTRYEYDSRGNLVKVTDARGNASYNYYDDRSRLILQIDGEGYATKTNYNALGDVTSVTRYYLKPGNTGNVSVLPTLSGHAKDATITFSRNNLGQVTSTTDAEGATETVYLNAFGEKYYSVNKLGGGTSYAYTRRGQLYYEYNNQLVSRNDGSTQAGNAYTKLYVYDSRGNVIQYVEGYALTERRDTYYAYDRANRLTMKQSTAVSVLNINTGVESTITPTETYKYDARGNLIETVDAASARTLFYYDEANRKIAEINAVGTHKTFIYDVNGNVQYERVYGNATAQPAAAGGTPPAPSGAVREILYAYDRANRRVSATHQNMLVGYYDGNYALETRSITSVSEFDGNGNLIREIDRNGAAIYHYYDRNGREVAKVDAENYLTTWARDSEGNVLEERRFANKVGTQFGLSVATSTAVSTLLSSAGYNGTDRITVFEYDRMGRRTLEGRYNVNASTVPNAASVSAGAVHSYIAYTYNAFGEVLSKTEATGDHTDYQYDSYGRMTRKIDPGFVNQGGINVRLTNDLYYDGLNNLVYERPSEYYSGADARANRYVYGAGGRLSQLIDTAGFTRTYYYDAAGRVVRERYTRQNSLGQNIREDREKVYDAVGRIVGEKVNSYNESTGAWTGGQTASTAYNAYGDVASRGINGSTAEQMVYDNAGRVIKSSAGDGVWKFFVYDGNGNVTMTMTSTAAADLGHWQQSDAVNNALGGATIGLGSINQYYVTASIVLYDRRNMATETFEPNRTISVNGNAAANTTQTLNTRRVYSAFGEVVSEQSARGYITNYTYNTMGRVIQVQAPEVTVTFENGATARQRPTENYAYDISGRLIGTQNANGYWTTRLLLAGTGYGDSEALVSVEYQPDGSTSLNGYDVYQNLRYSRDGLNRYTWYDYDAANRVIQVYRPSGNSEYFAYDGLGQRIKHWNNSYGTYYTETTDYDGLGRVTSSKTYAGETTSYVYSWNGGLATNGLGYFGGWTKTTYRPDYHSSSETTDLFGRITNRTDLGGRAYTYNYNEAGQLASQTSTAGQNISYTYHNTGRMATMLDNAGVLYGYSTSNVDGTYNYDADGNRTYERLAGTTTYYDPYMGYAGTPITVVYQEGIGTYDEMGRLLTFSDAGASGNGAVSISNAYDAAGNIRRTLATHGTFTANQTLGASVTDDFWYKYDALNRMTTVKGQLVGGVIVRGAGEGRDITYNLGGERATVSRTVTIPGGLSGYVWMPGYVYESREVYTYNADGLLTALNIAQGGSVTEGSTPPSATGPGVLRAQTSYDGMGRVTGYTEYAADGVTANFSRYGIYYDLRNGITQESSTLRRTESDGYLYVNYSTTYNSYAAGGLLTYSWTSNYRYKNGTNYQDSPDTSSTYTYAYWDSAVQSNLAYKADITKSTVWNTSYNYDLNGHLTLAQVNDGRPRSVTYVNDASGQILTRTEVDNVAYNATTGKGGDPKQVWWFFDGKQVGSTGNNGNDDPDYEAAINERVATPGAGVQGAFRMGSHYSTGFSDFDQAFNGLSPGEGGGAGSAYQVRQGDTLSSIAQAVFGDSALWYMIADANGLRSSDQLVAGQSITIPSKLANSHNRSDTFRPYDASRAIGDTQPTTPKPPKKPKCGVFGQILSTIVAVVAAIYLGPVLGNLASQAFNNVIGTQSGFSWKSLGMSVVSAGVTFGLGGAFEGVKSAFLQGALRAATGSILTQGIGVATGLQKKFDFVGVATAGLAGGVSSFVSARLDGRASSVNAAGKTVWANNPSTQFSAVVAGGAGAIAGAGARSVLTGTDFGDNLLASLPDVIGTAAGRALGAHSLLGDGWLGKALDNPIAAGVGAIGSLAQTVRSPEQAVSSTSDLVARGPTSGQPTNDFNSDGNTILVTADLTNRWSYASLIANRTLRPGQWHELNYPNTLAFPNIPSTRELDIMTPEARAGLVNGLLRNVYVFSFLDTISFAEGANYDSLVGDGYVRGDWKFDDYSTHPGYAGAGGQSAAGRYQIQKPTYDQFAPQLGITDFTPHSQDMIAVYMMMRKRPGMMQNLAAGNFREAVYAGAPEWASLPNRNGVSNYGQRVRSIQSLEEQFSGMTTFYYNNMFRRVS